MITLFRSIIIAMAVLAAMVLVFFGIRELRTGRGRHGLFITTLLAALGMAGCGGQAKGRPAAEEPRPGTGQAVVVAASASERSEQMEELAKTKQWADFKAFWLKLDRVRPTKEGEEAFVGEYYGSLTYEVAQGLREELKSMIGGLRAHGMKKLIGDLEVDLLEMVCNKRINYLEYGMQSMMTRMMPPPMTTEKESMIRDLERHIDVLVEMRESGSISTSEFEIALGIVEEDIKMYSVLDTLSGAFLGYWSPPIYPILEERAKASTAVSAAEQIIEAFESDYEAFQDKSMAAQQASADKELAKQYEKAKEAIDELKIVLPFLAELVADLES